MAIRTDMQALTSRVANNEIKVEGFSYVKEAIHKVFGNASFTTSTAESLTYHNNSGTMLEFREPYGYLANCYFRDQNQNNNINDNKNSHRNDKF